MLTAEQKENAFLKLVRLWKAGRLKVTFDLVHTTSGVWTTMSTETPPPVRLGYHYRHPSVTFQDW